jgi:hypothetical protein
MAKIGLDNSSKVNDPPYTNVGASDQESKVRILEDSSANAGAVAVSDLILLGGILTSSAKLIKSELSYGGAVGTPNLIELKSDDSQVNITTDHGASVDHFPSVELSEGSRLALLVDTAEAAGAIEFRAQLASNNE